MVNVIGQKSCSKDDKCPFRLKVNLGKPVLAQQLKSRPEFKTVSNTSHKVVGAALGDSFSVNYVTAFTKQKSMDFHLDKQSFI